VRANRLGWTASAAIAAAAVAICAGCGSSGTPADSSHASQDSPSAQAASPGAIATRTPQRPRSPAQAAEALQGPAAVPTAVQLAALKAQTSEIARLSVQQMAGQRVIYSYRGLTVPGWLLADVRHGLVGGVIFFSFNISSTAQIRRSIDELVAANDASTNPARRYPLLLMTDQEGGLVRRGRAGGIECSGEPAQCRYEREPRAGA
jgi:beta-N-acetylhexosaminidase